MDSVVAVSGGGGGKAAHMLHQQRNNENDLMRGANGHVVDDHRNGNVMPPGAQSIPRQSCF